MEKLSAPNFNPAYAIFRITPATDQNTLATDEARFLAQYVRCQWPSHHRRQLSHLRRPHQRSSVFTVFGEWSSDCFVRNGSYSPSMSYFSRGFDFIVHDVSTKLQIWLSTAAMELGELKHPDDVKACCFSPEGGYIATGCIDSTIRIWSASNYSCVALFHEQSSRVLFVSFLSGMFHEAYPSF